MVRLEESAGTEFGREVSRLGGSSSELIICLFAGLLYWTLIGLLLNNPSFIGLFFQIGSSTTPQDVCGAHQ